MFRALMKTPNDFAILFVRLGLGASLLAHGLATMGIFADDSPGLFDSIGNTATSYEALYGLAPWMTWFGVIASVVGSIALILGFFGRIVVLCIGAVVVVAAWKAGGLAEGEYLKWWQDATGTWGSYQILATLSALAILIRGSGAISIDHAISKPRF